MSIEQVKEIILTQSKVAIVDAKDFEWLNRFNWCAWTDGKGKWYALRAKCPSRSTKLRMHREILPPPKGYIVDHVNGNGLDNRRENLRICTNGQNQHNRGANWRIYRGTSKYKGVCWSKSYKKWIAQVKANGKHNFLGSFVDERDAAKAYDEAAIKFHGEFARTNKMMGLLGAAPPKE